eukprot:4031698-Prymnesium_polylepis.1
MDLAGGGERTDRPLPARGCLGEPTAPCGRPRDGGGGATADWPRRKGRRARQPGGDADRRGAAARQGGHGRAATRRRGRGGEWVRARARRWSAVTAGSTGLIAQIGTQTQTSIECEWGEVRKLRARSRASRARPAAARTFAVSATVVSVERGGGRPRFAWGSWTWYRTAFAISAFAISRIVAPRITIRSMIRSDQTSE